MKNYLFLFLLFGCCFSCFSQTLEFRGRITQDATNSAILGASIILKSNEKILGYSYSDDIGQYFVSVERDSLTEVKLEVNSLGSRTEGIVIPLLEQNVYINDFSLKDEAEVLSTVFISPDKKIEIKKDTIAYKVSRFTDKTERTVEDVLKNIPGIEIDQYGNIKAQGLNIQKILIEGDDLADSNYKVISQNLDAQVLDKVEVISNYDENPVLKKFLSSDAVVLNLRLKEEAKTVLFGNLEAGGGIENRYLADLNLGLIRPEIKFLNLGNINNIGRSAGDDLNNYVFEKRGFNDFNQNFEMNIDPPVYLKGSSALIEDRFYIGNKTFANNLLLNKTLKKKTKLRGGLFFFDDSFEKEHSALYRYFIKPEDIVFTEDNKFQFDNLNLSNDVEISHNISETDHLNFKNNFELFNEEVYDKMIFNDNEIIHQFLNGKKLNLESSLKYTKQIKGGAAVFDLYLGSKNLEQDLIVAPNTFEEHGDASRLESDNKSHLNYQGIRANFIFKKKRLSYSFAGAFRNISEVIEHSAMDVDNEKRIDSLSGRNKASSLISNFKLKTSYDFSDYTKLNSQLDIVHNHYENILNSKDFFFVNPELDFSSKTKLGNFRLGYSNNSEIPQLKSFLNNYLVRNYRGLSTGTGEIELIKEHNYFLSYTFSRPEKRILFTTSLSYTEFENYLAKNNFVSQELNIAQTQYAEGQNFLLVNSGFTTYIDKLSSTFKIGISHAKFESPSIINNEELVIKNQTNSIYLKGTTYFKGIYNLKISANYSLITGEIQGKAASNGRYNFHTENIIRFRNKLFGNLKNEIFLIDSELYESSTADIEYRPKESDWVYGLRAQNLFNTKEYVFANVSEFQQTQNVFEAVPRYLLLYAKVRF